MHCIELSGWWRCALGCVVAALAAGCSTRNLNEPPAPVTSARPIPVSGEPVPQPSQPQRPTPVLAPQPALVAASALPPPKRARDWQEFKVLAAQRLVEANRAGSYLGKVPEPLLAIPVLDIEHNGDGSVRRIVVKRTPSQAQDTIQLAIQAIHRAAPFGEVSHLPKPWTFSEVFLFDDDRRFKPRTLDL